KESWQEHQGAVEHLLGAWAETFQDATVGRRRNGLAALLTEFLAELGKDPRAPMVRAAHDLLKRPLKHRDLELRISGTDKSLRLVVIDRRRAGSDEQLRQTWSASRQRVTLDQHQGAVAERARHIG